MSAKSLRPSQHLFACCMYDKALLSYFAGQVCLSYYQQAISTRSRCVIRGCVIVCISIFNKVHIIYLQCGFGLSVVT